MNIIPNSGGIVKWSEKKVDSKAVAAKMYAAAKEFSDAALLRRSYAMYDCGRYVEMKICPDCGRAEVQRANLCRDRFCPTCAWRLSRRRFAEMCSTIALVEDLQNYTPAFLTLTVRNCTARDLGYTVKKMARDWNKLMIRKEIANMIGGFARSLEITYNAETKCFHPHYHVILLFKESKSQAAMQRLFRYAWRSCCRLEYEPITDFRFIDSECSPEKLEAAICETYKYTVKPGALAKMPLDIFYEMTKALKNIRTASFGGCIKAARALLGFSDTEEPGEEDSCDILGAACSCGGKMATAIAEWSFDKTAYKILEVLVKDEWKAAEDLAENFQKEQSI